MRPLVTVESESTSDLFCNQSIPDRLCDQRCRHIAANAVDQYHLPPKIQDCIQVQHALRCRNIGNVGSPESIGLTLLKDLLQQVRIFVHTLFELHISPSPPDLCEQIGLAHDAQKYL